MSNNEENRPTNYKLTGGKIKPLLISISIIIVLFFTWQLAPFNTEKSDTKENIEERKQPNADSKINAKVNKQPIRINKNNNKVNKQNSKDGEKDPVIGFKITNRSTDEVIELTVKEFLQDFRKYPKEEWGIEQIKESSED